MNLDLYDNDFFAWHFEHVHEQSVKVGAQMYTEKEIQPFIEYKDFLQHLPDRKARGTSTVNYLNFGLTYLRNSNLN